MHRQQKTTWLKLLLHLTRRIDEQVSGTNRHSTQVAHWSLLTCQALNCPRPMVYDTYWAALLHDVGKVGVPDKVLSKAGPLTTKEWELIRLHPTVGCNLVVAFQGFARLAPIIYAHQEKFDGSGYPEGLSGNQIPLGARILAVVDAYDAMTNDRVYSHARGKDEALAELRHQSGRQFDPNVVRHFIKVLEGSNSYPINSSIRFAGAAD
jgi:HD-GYP domain-containing protein (c-di-GMP phosphodiesterase class II)